MTTAELERAGMESAMQRTLVALLSALAMVLVACAPEDPGGPVSPTTTTEAPTTTTSGDST
ncbi:MAG: hypothetical protein S0880_36860, partial [Actinomycetota bacterium]|nr:hypothetical protein [Actinomycetota bacterium]